MSRTVSLVDMSEAVLRVAAKVGVGFPRLEDELTTIASELIVAAAETGELAVRELDGLRDEVSGDQKAATPKVPVTGSPIRIKLPWARKAVGA
jgi:hypothetical protein